MTPKFAQFAIMCVVAVSVGVTGCAWLQSQQDKARPVLEKVEQGAKYSLEVLQCARRMQISALEVGKVLAEAPALAICAALEASPDIAPSTIPMGPSKSAVTPETM